MRERGRLVPGVGRGLWWWLSWRPGGRRRLRLVCRVHLNIFLGNWSLWGLLLWLDSRHAPCVLLFCSSAGRQFLWSGGGRGLRGRCWLHFSSRSSISRGGRSRCYQAIFSTLRHVWVGSFQLNSPRRSIRVDCWLRSHWWRNFMFKSGRLKKITGFSPQAEVVFFSSGLITHFLVTSVQQV